MASGHSGHSTGGRGAVGPEHLLLLFWQGQCSPGPSWDVMSRLRGGVWLPTVLLSDRATLNLLIYMWVLGEGMGCVGPGGVIIWPIPVILTGELCPGSGATGSTEKLPGSCLAACWEDVLSSHWLFSHREMVGDFSFFRVFSAVAEFRGHVTVRCVCTCIGGMRVPRSCVQSPSSLSTQTGLLGLILQPL